MSPSEKVPSADINVSRALATEGFLSPDECRLLQRLAGTVTTGAIVEIGSYRGRSTVALACGANRNVPIYAIEPHETFKGVLGGEFGPQDRVAFCQNLLRAGVLDRVHLVNLTSEAAAKGLHVPIDLLWIDGDHREEVVRRDFDLWSPRVVPGGLIAFHDSTDPAGGPAKVVAFALSTSHFELAERVARTTVLRRISTGS